MLDVTLTINGRDFSSRLTQYSVEQEITYPDVVTTLDGTEHYGKPHKRDIINFRLMMFDDNQAQEDYDILTASTLLVTYTNPQAPNQLKSVRIMKVTSNLLAAFGIRSWNGLRYYTGGTITLRSVMVE
jgi:hypothetical protein